MKKNNDFEIFSIDDREYRTYFTKKFLNRKKWQSPERGKVFSFIPGVILKIMVQQGQQIEENDELLILEAMKMKNKLISPVSGKIKKIFVGEGVVVMKNQLLIEFE